MQFSKNRSSSLFPFTCQYLITIYTMLLQIKKIVPNLTSGKCQRLFYWNISYLVNQHCLQIQHMAKKMSLHSCTKEYIYKFQVVFMSRTWYKQHITLWDRVIISMDYGFIVETLKCIIKTLFEEKTNVFSLLLF